MIRSEPLEVLSFFHAFEFSHERIAVILWLRETIHCLTLGGLSMVKAIYINENKPYPNNPLPVLYYEKALEEVFEDNYTADDVISFFERNGYDHGWADGILDRHHFHSNGHEALACTKGEVTVQLGGPNADFYTLRKGDVVLLPAGTSHKKLNASDNFQIVGAYPSNGENIDMQYGDASDYEVILENIAAVEKPLTDPVTSSPRDIDEYWTLDS